MHTIMHNKNMHDLQAMYNLNYFLILSGTKEIPKILQKANLKVLIDYNPSYELHVSHQSLIVFTK